MRYGIVSDVHANLPALEATLAELGAADVDRIVCAGDLVGYGPAPNECVARLAGDAVPAVAGNHDLIAIGRLGFEHTDELARRTLEWTRSNLSQETRATLEELPPHWSDDELLVAHGSMGDPEVYVRTEEQATNELAALKPGDQPLLVLGHTHVPQAHGERRGRLLHRRAGTVEILPGERLLVNPGSVGQARERRPLARFAVVDTGVGTVTFRAIRYDADRTSRMLADAGLPAAAHHRRRSLRDRAAGIKAALTRTRG